MPWSAWKELIHTGNLLDKVYPVGSVYMSLSPTSPAALFGGIWAAIYDRFLVGAGSGYGVGTTGGAASVALTTAHMPVHAHAVYFGYDFATVAAGTSYSYVPFNLTTMAGQVSTTNAGNGSAFSIIPPYYAVYMWQRTA